MLTDTRTRVECPVCDATVDSLRGSPHRGPHLGVVYPCGCWLDVEDARQIAVELRARRERNDG